MTKQQADELIDLIVARAVELREAGVRSVHLGGGVGFALAAPEAPADDGEQPEEESPDALHDPWTHGVPSAATPKVLPKRSRSL